MSDQNLCIPSINFKIYITPTTTWKNNDKLDKAVIPLVTEEASQKIQGLRELDIEHISSDNSTSFERFFRFELHNLTNINKADELARNLLFFLMEKCEEKGIIIKRAEENDCEDISLDLIVSYEP